MPQVPSTLPSYTPFFLKKTNAHFCSFPKISRPFLSGKGSKLHSRVSVTLGNVKSYASQGHVHFKGVKSKELSPGEGIFDICQWVLREIKFRFELTPFRPTTPCVQSILLPLRPLE